MSWRLFQRLQHRIKGRLGQHMHLVDDIHLETPTARRVQCAFQQFAHVVHLRVGCRIQFDQIDKTSAVYFLAGAAFPAWRSSDTLRAVQRLGKDAGDSGLPYSACAGKQIGVVQPILCERVTESLDDVLLPRKLREGFGTPFARKNRCV